MYENMGIIWIDAHPGVSTVKDAGVDFKVQTEEFASDNEIWSFIKRFDHILIHLN